MFTKITLGIIGLAVLGSCQTPTNSTSVTVLESRIDSLFQDWGIPGHPGGSIGVMHNGELVYSKGHGLASLEHNVPAQDITIYNIASVSKQFTAYAISLLEEQGKLSIDDDIRKYFPEFADFGETVTIRHMIHHSSGLRSLHAMLQMAGWRGSDHRDNKDLVRFMSKQKELNFKPGDEYLYCNTGYILMAEIVEKVTGQDFISWMDENIFDPLRMENTYLEEKYTQIIPNNAQSYNWNRADSTYTFSVPYWGYIGSGNVHTTTSDLLKWQAHLAAPNSDEKAVAKMFTRGIFNSGDTSTYAFGQTITNYKGKKKYGHGGSIGGYRANIATVPEEELHVVVIANFSNSGPAGLVNEIIDIVLNNPKDIVSEEEERAPEPAPQYLAIPESISGSYYSPELETTYTIELVNETTVKLHHTRHGDFKMRMEEKGVLSRGNYAIYSANIIYGSNNTIIGIKASNGRVRNLWFEKVN